MVAATITSADIDITGTVTPGNDTVTNAKVKSDAAIAVTKLKHLHKIGTDGGIDYAGTVAAKRKVVFVATGACTIRKFGAVLVGANTAGTTGFDCHKNNATILTGHVTFTSADASGTVKTGTLSTTTLAADDIVDIEFTEDAVTMDGTGPFAWIEIDEAAN